MQRDPAPTPPSTVLERLERVAERHAGRAALTFLQDGTPEGGRREVGFAELVQTSRRLADGLRSLALPADATVAAMLPSKPEMHAFLWGASDVRDVLPINPMLRPDAIARLLAAARAAMLFVPGGPQADPLWAALPALRAALPGLRWIVQCGGARREGDGVLTFEALLDADASTREPRAPRARFGVMHTGGTTATPKLAQLTQANVLAAVDAIVDALGYASRDTVAAGLPLFHIAGAVVAGLAPLCAGARVVMPGAAGFREPRAVAEFWRTVAAERVDVLAAVPTTIGALAQTPIDADHSSLRFALTGTAALPAGVRERFERHVGIALHEAYGMTETAGALCFSRRDEPREPGSVGRAVRGAEVRVCRSRDGRADPRDPCASGEPGTVLVRGPMVFAGYVGDPAATRAALLDGGWLDTGDLGSMDAHGRLRLTGRAKDLIIRGGHNIDPAVIEDAASLFDSVQHAAAVGLPDRYAGEVPVLFVSARAGATVDTERLAEWLQARVSDPVARPRAIEVLPEIPLTAVGKIFKPPLRELAARMALRRLVADTLGSTVESRVRAQADPGGRIDVEVEVDAGTEERARLQALASELNLRVRVAALAGHAR